MPEAKSSTTQAAGTQAGEPIQETAAKDAAAVRTTIIQTSHTPHLEDAVAPQTIHVVTGRTAEGSDTNV